MSQIDYNTPLMIKLACRDILDHQLQNFNIIVNSTNPLMKILAYRELIVTHH